MRSRRKKHPSMKITGEHRIHAPAEKVWEKILDPRVLERITPGIKSLEELGPDHYKAISEVKMGPVKGRFEGDFSILDKVEGKSCKVSLDQKSKIGNALAEISMELKPVSEDETLLTYTGDARISGMLARMGQRLIGSVVKTFSKQFFEALEKEVEEEKPG